MYTYLEVPDSYLTMRLYDLLRTFYTFLLSWICIYNIELFETFRVEYLFCPYSLYVICGRPGHFMFQARY